MKETNNPLELISNFGVAGTAYIDNWSSPEKVDVIEKSDSIEFIYKQVSLLSKGYNPLETRVFKIIFSCVNGKWNKSKPIYGEIIPATKESYEFIEDNLIITNDEIDDSKEDLNLPEIGKKYYCFDDGKILESRRYEVTITEIIPFEKADKKLISIWRNALGLDWLFDKTDYFIRFKSNENTKEPNGVFARTKNGRWFGLGRYWNSGVLDIDGSLNDSITKS